MDISIQHIKTKLLQKNLPGTISHSKMAPLSRMHDLIDLDQKIPSAKKSAVMLLLFHENKKVKVIFIRRSFYVGIHAGQLAFPGGRFEEEDVEVKNTAFREIHEEIGIENEKIELLGRLSDIYVPASNFLISVFVGYLNEKPSYKIDEREVAEIIEIDLIDFFTQANISEKEFNVPLADKSVLAPFYNVGNVEIWGASAMVMSEFLDIIS